MFGCLLSVKLALGALQKGVTRRGRLVRGEDEVEARQSVRVCEHSGCEEGPSRACVSCKEEELLSTQTGHTKRGFEYCRREPYVSGAPKPFCCCLHLQLPRKSASTAKPLLFFRPSLRQEAATTKVQEFESARGILQKDSEFNVLLQNTLQQKCLHRAQQFSYVL